MNSESEYDSDNWSESVNSLSFDTDQFGSQFLPDSETESEWQLRTEDNTPVVETVNDKIEKLEEMLKEKDEIIKNLDAIDEKNSQLEKLPEKVKLRREAEKETM